MSLFLLLSLRQNEAVAALEYRDFLRATGLRPERLEQRVLGSPAAGVGPLDRYAGVFVGGSSLNMTDPDPGAWQRHVVRELTVLIDGPAPVFFTCFGTGLIARAVGGSLGHDHAERAGRTRVEVTPEGRRDPIFGGLPAVFPALTGHTECVLSLPARAAVLASGPSCPVQALRVGGHTWATQFHPEMDPPAMARRMDFYRHHGYFDEEEYDSIVESLHAVDTGHAHRVLGRFVDYCLRRSEHTPDYTDKVCMPS
ncbi:glutamine amidotransferase [Corynebacterium mastitidis]|uniref:glutamine amidotransferase n=1 Tax=Corynebacterium mastitidis TaxID=161890 RepID=UPI000364D593|nr:glutamine amidotransferase [Corynebacterium mastitidis]